MLKRIIIFSLSIPVTVAKMEPLIIDYWKEELITWIHNFGIKLFMAGM